MYVIDNIDIVHRIPDVKDNEKEIAKNIVDEVDEMLTKYENVCLGETVSADMIEKVCNPTLPKKAQKRFLEIIKSHQDMEMIETAYDAADELFAGYGFDVLKAYPDAKGKAEIDQITMAYLNQRSEMGYDPSSAEFKRQRNKLYRDYMTKYYAKKLLGRADVSSAYADHPNWKKLDNLNKVLFVSTHETILPTLLRNYDRDSMASGVEIRMPFLDYRIVEFAFSIGWKSKLHGGFSKSIVRDACADFMPHDIAYRRTKLGFNAPILDWMRGPYRQFFEDTVADPAFANCSLIDDATGVRADLAKFLNGENATFHQAADIWNRIQPYLWERALIRQDWR